MQPQAAGSVVEDYLFLVGAGIDLAAGGMIEDEGGAAAFFGCLGFLASRLPRCCPLGIPISLAFARTVGALHRVRHRGRSIMAPSLTRAMFLPIGPIATFTWPVRRCACILQPIQVTLPAPERIFTMLPSAKDLEGKPVPKVTFKTRVNEKWKDVS